VFEALTAWFERRRALRELRASSGEASRGYSKFFAEQMEAAKDAFDRGNSEWALLTWRDLNERFPRLSITSARGLNLAVDLGRYDEVEALIREALRRYPWHRVMLTTVYARAAQGRGDTDETLRRCEILRRKFPKVPEGYTIAAACLAGLGRPKDAEDLIDQAARRFPNNYDIAVAHARYAERRKDWPQALERWRSIKERFENFLAPVGMAQCLREMGRSAEAKEVATEACDRYPKSPWPHVELARIAAADKDLERAAQCWEVVRERFPDFAVGYMAGADVARWLGLESDADRILSLGIRRLRYELAVHLEYARSADRRGDRTAAKERWSMVRDRFPDCIEACERDAAMAGAMPTIEISER
jgi:tetratricopeptide (TPR) repeat protein